MLLRQRLFYEAGIQMPLLTFDQNTDYKIVHQQLVADGYLHPDAEILNIWRWFVDHELSETNPISEFESTPIGELTTEVFEMDGDPWLTIHNLGDIEIAKEYFRSDGTIAIRLVSEDGGLAGLTPGIELVGASGQVINEFKTLREFYRFWVTLLSPGSENVFLISDSRIIIPSFLEMGTRYFTLLQIHTPHSSDDRHFLAPIRGSYLEAFAYQNQLDALCILTERQKSDIGKRFGLADNLFVVRSGVLPAQNLDEQKHRANLITTTTRFHPAKGTDKAVHAFAKLLERVPDAKFDIYGDGELREEVESLISELGIGHAVNLRGYDPNARERLNDAVCYWNTSKYEGYPLATLEAMSQGCPVVAFDVKYGLNEQVIDGYNGFLTKSDDLDTFVERTISIMRDRELFDRLSKGALETAQSNSPENFLEATVKVLWEIVEKKSRRTKVAGINIEQQDVRFAQHLKFLRFQPDLRLELDMELLIDSHSAGQPLSSADFFLELVSPQSEELVRLPMQTASDGKHFQISASISGAEMRKAISQLGQGVLQVELRTGFVWGNSSWVHPLSKRVRVLTGSNGKVCGFAADTLLPKSLLGKTPVRHTGS